VLCNKLPSTRAEKFHSGATGFQIAHVFDYTEDGLPGLETYRSTSLGNFAG
jgi:hypothetical protein